MHKEVASLLQTQGVIETTPVFVVRAPLVVQMWSDRVFHEIVSKEYKEKR